MKNRIMTALLVLSMTVVCMACGGKESSQEAQNESGTSSITEELEEVDENIEGMLIEDSEVSTLEEHFQNAVRIQMGQRVESEGVAALSFDEAYWCKEILPENTDGSYNYIEEQDGFWYLVLKGTIENQSQELLEMDTSSIGSGSNFGVIIYNNCYYQAKMAAGSEEQRNISSRVESNSKVPLYLFTAIPDSEKMDTASAKMYLAYQNLQETVYNQIGNLQVDWEKCKYMYSLDFEVKGEVK